MGIVCTRKFRNSKSKSSRGKSHMDVKILERLNRSWIDKPTWQMPQPPTCQAINPAGPPVSAGFFSGLGQLRSHGSAITDFCNKICHNRTLFKRTLDETAPRH